MAKINNSGDVSYTIAAQDVTDSAVNSAVSGMERLRNTSERMAARMKAHWKELQQHWIGVTAAIYASYKTVQAGWDLAEENARFEQSKAAFRSMAASMGQDADRLYRKLKETSAGLIDEKTLTEAANRAMSLGIPIEKIAELMEIARAKARDMGTDTTKAFNDIVTGIGRASPLILDNLGITIKIGDANERMARTLNKTASALTEDEKKLAVLNATIEAGREALGRYDMTVLTNYERMQQLKATLEDTKLLLGQGVTRAALAAAGAFQWLASGALTVVSGFLKLMEIVKRSNALFTMDSGKKAAILAEAEAYRVAYEAAQNGAVDLAGKASEKIKAAFASVNDLTTATAKNIGAASTRAMVTDAGSAGGNDDTAKALAEELAMRQQFYADLNEAANIYNRGVQDAAEEERQRNAETLQQEYERRVQFFQDVNEAHRIARQIDEAIETESLELRLQRQQQAASAETAIRSQVANNAVSLLMMLGTKNKEFALAGIAIATALEMIRAYQAAVTASTLAFASQLIPGDPTSLARAAAAAAATMSWGMVNVGLIAATGAMRAADAMSNSTSAAAATAGYNPATPVETIANQSPAGADTKKVEVTINFVGGGYLIGTDPNGFARELAPYINKAIEDGVH